MIQLFILAKPKAKENRVEKIDNTHFRIWVKASPDRGRANEAILEVLGDYLGVPKSRLVLLRGHRSKNKVVGYT